ncbi:MAG: lysophospholipid acyltransferase family protein [Lysobacterales bacterium]
MNSPQHNSATPTASTNPWGAFRMLWRLPLLAIHAVVFLPVTLVVVAQGHAAEGWRRRWAEVAMGLWSGALLKVFGFRIEVSGKPHAHPVVLLANHVSWADIELIHSQMAAGFVAKAEIARWPVIGFMAKVGGTVFHQRGQRSSQERVTAALADKLKAGRSIAIFPEGRTGAGRPVLAFHGRLLQAAVDTTTPIQAVAIEFLRDGEYAFDIPFTANESFGASLVRMLRQPLTTAKIHFLESRPPDAGRTELARWAHGKVAHVVERREIPHDSAL